MKTPAELRKQRQGLVNELRAMLDVADEEDRDLTEGETTQYEETEDQIRKMSEEIERRERLEGMKADAQPTRMAPAHHKRPTPDTPEGIYCRYIRSGDAGALVELRASNATDMNIGTDADGGYAVPTGHYQGIIERARPRALPFLMDIRSIPGRGTTVNVPVDNEADNGAFVSTVEANDFDQDAPALSQVAMTLVKYTKRVELSYELLEDEDSRLLAFLEGYVGAGYAATLNSLMVTEALADGTAALTLDSATVIAAAEIPELFYKLSSEYAEGNVAWLMQRAVEGEVFSLASSSVYTFTGTPAGGALGQRPTLWGAPVYTNSGMGATAASGKSLLIADWSYMGMRLGPEMTFLRDPYTMAISGQVRLLYYFRADFEVLQAGAFQYATHPTA